MAMEPFYAEPTDGAGYRHHPYCPLDRRPFHIALGHCWRFEHHAEFGIRKAIGAKPWSILKLIIVESVIITTFFGYIGMVLGVAANEYMDATIGHETIDTGLFKATMFLDPTVGLDVCIEATMVMIIAGTMAGLIPAFKASRIRPIEALRAD